jgi:hypothetical protein
VKNLLLIVILALSGCATTYTDSQLRAMDNERLFQTTLLRTVPYYDDDYRSETAKRAIATYCDRAGWPEKVKRDLIAGKLWLGMSNRAALMSQGRPTRINTQAVGLDQWVYLNAIGGGSLYLYFEKDTLVNWQRFE